MWPFTVNLKAAIECYPAGTYLYMTLIEGKTTAQLTHSYTKLPQIPLE